MLIRHPCLGAQAELYLGPRGLRAYFPRVEFQELRTQFMERGFDMEIGQYFLGHRSQPQECSKSCCQSGKILNYIMRFASLWHGMP